jgi:hypothetical protein
MVQAKYQVGDIVQLEEKVLEILEVSQYGSYRVKYVKSPYSVEIGFERWITSNIVDELYVLVEKKAYANTTGCECGAHKLGYIKPSRSHSSWCALYKE